MASAFITTRKRTGKKRHVVRYRLGGRAYPIQHGGSFKTEREAKERLRLIGGELAAGRNPAIALRAMVAPPVPARTFRQVADAYRASKINLADTTTDNNEAHYKAFSLFDDRDPAEITFEEIQAWVTDLASRLKPGTIRVYMATLRQVFDYAKTDPNPARDRLVKLPRMVKEEPNPPTSKQLLRILDATPSRRVLPFILMEQTAMEPGATGLLQVGDLDIAGCQLRLRRETVKGSGSARARWVQVPEWLMEAIESTLPPLEDREMTARVFPWLTTDVAWNVMDRACKTARVAHFSPYDLRHRRLSLWHGQGVPARELAARAGHTKATMTLDVYSHVLIDPTEITPAEYAEVLSRCGLRVVPEEA